MQPPTAVACPSMYLVVECVIISTPNSKGLQLIGVGNVLSTITGIPASCATFTNLSKSRTAKEGLEMDSARMHFVFGLIAALKSSSEISGSTTVVSIPILLTVVVSKLNVPP